MMKARIGLVYVVCASSSMLMASQRGPMDAEWFYNPHNPFSKANNEQQNRRWGDAECAYKKGLEEGLGDDYDKNNAQVNLAACLFAQGEPSEGWASFDKLLGIPEDKQISQEKIENAKSEEKKSILILTNNVGIGDIGHFLKAGDELKKRTGWDVTISVPGFLKGTFSGPISAYGLNVVGARDPQPETDYATHLIGLLGHLKVKPADTAPEKVLLTAPDRAVNAVNEQIKPLLEQNKRIGIVFLGENRPATLIGGKQLPRDTTKHGRHLDSAPFQTLLRNHSDLVLIDCGNEKSRLVVDADQQDRCVQVAPEKEPFDTIVALALAMSVNNRIVAFGADNGPTNIFARALNREAQRRMALIIPNGSKDNGEYDMRMEGEGSVYTQLISNCRVYKCETPQDQAAVIEKAYQDMTK
jgi:hypothetical protein